MFPGSLVFMLNDFKCVILTGEGWILTREDNVDEKMISKARIVDEGKQSVKVETNGRVVHVSYKKLRRAVKLACLLTFEEDAGVCYGSVHDIMEKARISVYLTGEGIIVLKPYHARFFLFVSPDGIVK